MSGQDRIHLIFDWGIIYFLDERFAPDDVSNQDCCQKYYDTYADTMAKGNRIWKEQSGDVEQQTDGHGDDD